MMNFSSSVFYVGSDVFQLSEDFREEAGIWVDSQHGCAQLVDDVDASVPKSILVRLHKERFQGVAYFISHVTENNNNKQWEVAWIWRWALISDQLKWVKIEDFGSNSSYLTILNIGFRLVLSYWIC